MRYLLNAAYIAGLGLCAPWLAYKAATTGKYRSGWQAKLFGQPPRVTDQRPVVWLHAVSVGEVLLLRPLIEKLQADRPDLQLVLSTSTDTGYKVANEKYPQLSLFYAPFDFTWAIEKVIRILRPHLLVLTELELWPNLLLTAERYGIPVAVINTRLSERSYRGYRRLSWLLRRPLQSIRWWGVQTPTYAKRVADLIDTDAPITLTGSLKYENAIRQRYNPKTNDLRHLLGFTVDDIILVAGSTMEPEEEILCDAYQELLRDFPHLKLIIVPRHPERFGGVAAMLAKRPLGFCRRSEVNQQRPTSAPITLIDTVGELAAIWGLADFGFVGGSLENGRGGQSMIEPAGYGVPVCFGPSTSNFRDTVEQLLEQQAAIQLSNRSELVPTLRRWLNNPAAANEMGQRAKQMVEQQAGALAKTITGLLALLPATSQRQVA